jgi:hypothetical protein
VRCAVRLLFVLGITRLVSLYVFNAVIRQGIVLNIIVFLVEEKDQRQLYMMGNVLSALILETRIAILFNNMDLV